MQCMFEEDARDSLIKYLGYVQTEEKVEEKEEEKEEEKKEVAASITAEDLFASAPMTPSAEAQETVQESKETPKETSSSPVTSPVAGPVAGPAEWEEALKQRVIVGDFAGAVEVCFRYERFADALVIATWGGAELAEQTTVGVRERTDGSSATWSVTARRCCASWRQSYRETCTRPWRRRRTAGKRRWR